MRVFDKIFAAGLASLILSGISTYAQDIQLSASEKVMIELSNAKWQWMSEKNVEKLADLFHETAQFVHMGGYWGKDQELKTIESGGIWYKKAEIHDQKVEFTDNTATVYSVIHLNSEVGGNAVRFPFIVTEVYVKESGRWKLTSLVFTRTLGD